MANPGSTVESDEASSMALELSRLLADLIERAQVLKHELKEFREHLRVLRKDQHTIIASFRGTVQSELTMLEKLSARQDQRAASHIARSSNLPFLETVWNAAKRSRDLTALQQRVYFNSPVKSLSQSMRLTHLDDVRLDVKRPKDASTVVDAIVDGGRTWVKISLVTNTRLLFDLAKQGWQSEGSDEDEGLPVFGSQTDDDSDVPLVKTARELCRAATSYRVKTRQPKVHMILPRVVIGQTPEIDAILEDCRLAGAIIFIGEDLSPIPAMSDAFHAMAPDPVLSFSPTINVDCTILLALVSEISHAKVSKEPWFDTALQRQVETEDNENLLPSLLYPALGHHKLCCTREAAKRMREIVATIGTPSEKARTKAMMGDNSLQTQMELVNEMQQWSSYPVPQDLQLPIYVVDQNEDNCQSKLPPEALEVSIGMTDINRSVFLYGWSTGATTLTSNRAVAKQLETGLEKFVDLDDSVWPSIWLCPTARSLVGKERRGTKIDDKQNQYGRSLDPQITEVKGRNGLNVLDLRAGHGAKDLKQNGYHRDEVLEA